MDMQAASLHLADGETIPVKIASSRQKVLLECERPQSFLSYITQGRWVEDLEPDTFLRGVVFDDEEAIFSLCNPFGIIADEIVRLSAEQARILILERLW